MSYEIIQSLLDTRLQTLNLPVLQLENKQLNTVSLQKFVRSTILPGKTVTMTLGPGGWNIMSGIYQVDIFEPHNEGIGTSNALVDDVLAVFPVGLRLNLDNNLNLMIEQGNRAPGITLQKYYCVPVSVAWSAYVKRAAL